MGLYPKNQQNKSTWAALDFDAHDPTQKDIAYKRALGTFRLARAALRQARLSAWRLTATPFARRQPFG